MIRNFLFSFFFFLGIFLISILFIPTLFMPQKIVLFGGKIMGNWAAFCVRFFLSTEIIIKGRENIIINTKFFIASSHQSMFETFILQTIFNSPIFILKKEDCFLRDCDDLSSCSIHYQYYLLIKTITC